MGDTPITNSSTGVTSEQLGGSGPQTDLTPENTPNMPAGATKVENGIAYDKSGKALGPVNTPAEKPSGIDLSSGLVPKAPAPLDLSSGLVPKAPEVLAKQAAWQKAGQQTPDDRGTLHKLWDWANKGLISKDTIVDVLQRASATGKYQDVLTRGIHPQVDIPGFGRIDLDTLQKGVTDSSSGVASSFTSPLSIALFGSGAVAKAVPAAATLVPAAAPILSKVIPAVNAAGHAAGVGFGVQGAQAAFTPRQEGETEADALERRLMGASQIFMASAGARGTKADVSLTEAAKNAHEFVNKAVEGTTQAATDAAKAVVSSARQAVTLGAAPTVIEAVRRQSPPSKGYAPEYLKTLKRSAPDLDAILQQDPRASADPQGLHDAIQAKVDSITDDLLARSKATIDETKPVVPDIENRVREAMNNYAREHRGEMGSDAEVEAAMQKVMEQILRTQGGEGGEPPTSRAVNLHEAEGLRRKLNKDGQRQFATNAQPTTDAYKLLSQHVASEVLRPTIDERFTADGVDGVKEARTRIADLIDVKDQVVKGQALAEKMGQPGIIKSIMTKLGTPQFILALTAGAYAPHFGIPGLIATVLGDRIAHNLTNPNVNAARAGELARNAPPQAGVSIDTSRADQRGLPPAGGPPAIPAPPQPPVPQPPPTNHDLHAALATYYDVPSNSTEPSASLEALLQKFYKNGQDIAEGKITLTPEEAKKRADMLDTVNKATAEDRKIQAEQHQKAMDKYNADQEKAAEKAQKEQEKAADKAAKEAEKQAAEQQKAAEEKQKLLDERKAAEEKEQQKTADNVKKELADKKKEDLKAKENPEKEPKPKPAGRQSLIGNLTRVVHGVGDMLADQRLQRTPARALYGHSDESAMGHEWGHVARSIMEGLKSGDISSHLHADSQPATTGGAPAFGGVERVSRPLVEDEDVVSKYTPEQVVENARKHVRANMAGAVVNELIHGIPIEDNAGLHTDMAQSRQWLTDAGLTEEQAEVEIQNAINKVREDFQAHPQILDAIRENSHVRERGLDSTLHASKERVKNFEQHIKEIIDANENDGHDGPSNRGDKKESNAGVQGKDSEAGGETARGESKGQVKRAEIGQGGHAGGGVASEEELARPGRFVKVSRSGIPTDQNKVPDFNLRPGEAGYQVTKEGPKLVAGEESPSTKRGAEAYHKEVFGQRANLQGTATEEPELRVPFKEGRTIPPERTAGKHDAAIKAGGGVPGGIQEGDPEINLPDLVLFHDPTTGSTLALKADGVTPEAVKNQIQKSRQTYLAAKPEESRIPTPGQPGYDEAIHGKSQVRPEDLGRRSELRGAAAEETEYHPDLQKLADTYGATTDPTSVKNGASFIAPDGKFINLGSTEHPVAIESATNRGGDAEAVGARVSRSENTEIHNPETGKMEPVDNRIGFMRDTGAIRTRFRQSMAGKELVASVPAKGVTEDQISALRQAVGQGLGRNGNLLIEVGEPGGKSASKEFASPRDVEPMLKEIGAHPESEKTPLVNEQIAAHEKEGGSTFTPEGENLAGKDLYSVAPYPERSQIVDKLTPEILDAYKEKNADLLNDGHHAVGTWKDPDSGKTYLDVAKTIADRDAAIKTGQDANQKAIYHLGSGETIPTGGTGEVPEISRSELRGTPISDALVEKHGTTDDPLAHGFILSDGRRVDMGDQIHEGAVLNILPKEQQAAILQGPDAFKKATKNLEDFLNKEGVIRVRPREWGSGGKEISLSIPSKLTEEQLQAIRQSVGKMRDGSLVMERAGFMTPSLRNQLIQQGASSDLLKGKAVRKDFARPSDVNDLVKELGAYPESERSELRGKPTDVKKAQDTTDVHPVGSSVVLRENPLPVKPSPGTDIPSTVDVAMALNKFTKKQLPALELGKAEPQEMVDRAKSLAEDEARYQLAQNNTGAAWYTTQMAEHDRILQGMRPETKDPAKLSMFKFAEAILSSGQKPYANFKTTVRAWDQYQETGKFPAFNPDTKKSWGPRGIPAYGNAFESLNRLIAERGEQGAKDWLLSEHPVSELKEYNDNVKGKKDDQQLGALILGPKRGPFAQNLHGLESAFTADMWVARTWHRWMGTAEIAPDGELATDRPRSDKERELMKKSFSETADKLGMTTSSLQAVLWYYEQALYSAHGSPKESWSFSDAAQRVADDEASTFNFGHNRSELRGGPQQAAPKTYSVPAGWSETGPTKAPGLITPGNINLTTRPVVKNDDGTTSSEYSTSFQDDKGHEVIVPTVVNGKFLTPDGKKPKPGSPEEKAMFKKAWQHYEQTGEHLGIYDTPEHADAAASAIHSRPPVSAAAKSGLDTLAGK